MITILAIMLAACFGLVIGGSLARAKECDFCNDCAYKIFYIESIKGQ